MDPNLLQQVLNGVLSTENAVREAAEKTLNEEWLAKHPRELFFMLCQTAVDNATPQIRSLCLVLFRRLALAPLSTPTGLKHSPWSKLDDGDRATIKNLLLRSLFSEKDEGVLHKACDAVAEVARTTLLTTESWNDLLNSLFELSKQSAHRAAALRIFYGVPELLVKQNPSAVKDYFAAMLTSDARLEAVKAFTTLMYYAEKPMRNTISPLLPHTLEALNQFYLAKDEDSLVECLNALTELSEECATSWKPIFPNCAQVILTLVNDTSLDNPTRQASLELFLTITEIAPGLVKKHPHVVSQVLQSVMKLITEVDDDDSWGDEDENDDDDSDDNFVAAAQALDRIAIAIGGKLLLPTLFSLIPAMMNSPKWQDRYGALMSIASFAEGCAEELEANLQQVLGLVFSKFNDPHDRVKYAACHALGQLSTDFSEIIQEQFHKEAMFMLLQTINAKVSDRVKAHAAAALINFSDGCDSDIIAPYLDDLLQSLLSLLNSQKVFLLEQVLSTISNIADAASSKFAKYHTAILPMLMNILVKANDPKYLSVRARALECISLVAVAIGKELFSPYLNDYVGFLVNLQSSNLPDDDPVLGYLSSAWVRMCKILQAEFIPLLDHVMPPLMKAALVEPDLALLDMNDDTEEFGNEWDFVNVNGKKIGIKTSTLDEKNSAIDSLTCYCQILGPGFQKYAEETLKIMVPLFKFDFHDGVKISAAASIPCIFECFVKSKVDKHYISQMWTHVSSELFSSITRLYDSEYAGQAIMSIHDTIEALGKEFVTQEFFASLDQVMSFMAKSITTKLKETAERDEDENDEGGNDDEESVLVEIARLLHILFKFHGLELLPFFEKFLPFFGILLSHPDPGIQHVGICIFDDLVEFAGPASFKHFELFGRPLMEGLKSSKPEMRQACAYGVGICAKFGGSSYARFCSEAVPLLVKDISDSKSKLHENVMARDNCVSALAKIIKFNGSGLGNMSQVLGVFVSSLPVKTDLEEVAGVYDTLLCLIEQQSGLLLSSKENIAYCIVALFEMLSMDLAPELHPRAIQHAKRLMGMLSTQEMSQVLSKFPEEAQKKLSVILQ